MVTLVMLVLSLILLVVAFAVGDSSSAPSDKDSFLSAPKDSTKPSQNSTKPSQDTQASASASNGSVATVKSRSNYSFSNSDSYRTVGGITSQHAVLLNVSSYEAVAGTASDARICPASMTKVMTLVIACENLRSLNDTVKISTESISYQASHGGSGLSWTGGETVSVEDLLYLAFLRSDTVACLELANYVAGSESAFVKLMNEKVSELGLSGTRFTNCTGLDDGSYYSTCRDIASIMAYALDNSLAKKVMTLTGVWYLPKGAPVSEIKATWITDRFGTKTKLDTVTMLAAKTGWEDACGSCLVSYAKSDDGTEYIMVVVGGSKGVTNKQTTADVKNIYNTYAK